MHRKYKYLTLGLGAGLIPIGLSLINSSSAHAASLNPSVTISIPTPDPEQTKLEFKGANGRAEAEYTIPVAINYTDVKNLQIAIYATNDMSTNVEGDKAQDGMTTASGNTIDIDTSTNLIPGDIETDATAQGKAGTVSLIDTTSGTKLYSLAPGELKTVGQMVNAWGYRYKLADSDGTPDNEGHDRSSDLPSGAYAAMPSAASTPADRMIASASIAANTMSMDSNGRGTKYLNLGFGAGITKSQLAGTYRGRAIISIVAEANSLTLFDMEARGMSMQEMTSDICDNTPTPSNTIIGPSAETKVAHKLSDITMRSDGYADKVPEVILKDIRDNNEYLIRKLADGNCWMSQDLAFDFVNSKGVYSSTGADLVGDGKISLSYLDTDLPEGMTWTPEAASASGFKTFVTQNNAGAAWGGRTAKELRSFSYGAMNADWAYASILSTADNTITFTSGSTGEPYGKYGVLYNWIAATLGSGLTATSGERASSSICPASWELSTYSSNAATDKSYTKLLTIYGVAMPVATDYASLLKYVDFPLNMYPSGAYYEAAVTQFRLTNKPVWTATSTGAGARYLDSSMSSRYVKYMANEGATLGYAVRCVAK